VALEGTLTLCRLLRRMESCKVLFCTPAKQLRHSPRQQEARGTLGHSPAAEGSREGI